MRTRPVVAVLGGLVAAWVALRACLYTVRRGLAAARFGFYVATLQLYRRCPDCKSYIHHHARLCRRCGFRLGPKPSR
jgi:Zn finger protein HypA/HybF involved in hydrogenase expression